MGKNTKIEWTDHTWNGWWGCVKVSPGCENCYAETFSKRVGRNIWGPAQTTERWKTKSPWRECLKWDAQALANGVRQRVFVQSMSDFFEDHPQVEPWRGEAFKILEGFKALDVQLLTKRPENVLEMVPRRWLNNWPTHVWMGVSVEDQKRADLRIPYLLRIPAPVLFLSCEPLLGPVDLTAVKVGVRGSGNPDQRVNNLSPVSVFSPRINWVIVGGESGHHARPMHPEWARSIIQQCKAANTPIFMKQMGEVWAKENLATHKGG